MTEVFRKKQLQADSGVLPADENLVFVSDKQLGARYGVHRTAIWRWLRSGNFPKPVKLSPGCTRWKMADILEHENRTA
jgi:prophage regulatory protein